MNDKTIIGRVEQVSFPIIGIKDIPAKIDTGADLSSIWATNIRETKNGLSFVLFGDDSTFYTGKIFRLSPGEYTITRISNSFGHKEYRYRVKLTLKIAKKKINATFTLSDRKDKLYPVLIGRRTINNKFYVDVASGSPLRDQELERSKRLSQELQKLKVTEK